MLGYFVRFPGGSLALDFFSDIDAGCWDQNLASGIQHPASSSLFPGVING
jgi:hypothetical protein